MLLTLPVRADLALDYQVVVDLLPDEGEPEQFTQSMHVVLKGPVLEVVSDEWTNRYNFATRRLQRLDQEGLSDQSLYSAVAFRAFELENRVHLGGALAAAGVESPMQPALMEHLFSVRGDPPAPVEVQTKPGGGLLSQHQGKTLFESSAEGVALEGPAEVEEFRRFLRHQTGGHPAILEKLDHVPQEMTLSFYDIGGARRMRLTLGGHRRETVDLPELSREPPRDRLGELEHKARAAQVPQVLAELESRALALFEQGALLPAALRFTEIGLVTGEQLPEAFQERREQLFQDPGMARLAEAVKANDEEQAQAALVTLSELEPAAGEAVHVLWIFQANFLAGLGQTQESQELFLKALEANPALVGVWKDLGFLFLRQYEMADAWRCWDTARAVVPASPMLAEVEALEQELLTKHPEFF